LNEYPSRQTLVFKIQFNLKKKKGAPKKIEFATLQKKKQPKKENNQYCFESA